MKILKPHRAGALFATIAAEAALENNVTHPQDIADNMITAIDRAAKTVMVMLEAGLINEDALQEYG